MIHRRCWLPRVILGCQNSVEPFDGIFCQRQLNLFVINMILLSESQKSVQFMKQLTQTYLISGTILVNKKVSEMINYLSSQVALTLCNLDDILKSFMIHGVFILISVVRLYCWLIHVASFWFELCFNHNEDQK